MVSEHPLDLLVLDLGLPDGDGGDFLRLVRAQYTLPILIISARHDDANKVKLLDAGADDYLVKPFSIGELLARMRVTLRHRGTVVLAPQTHYRCASIEIDLAKHTVLKAGEPVHLTPTEFKLLARLVRQVGQVVTHRQLLVDVWGAEHVDQTHYLRLYMGQLRAKLESNPTEPTLLLTEPGVGYRLVE
jgi:two-component system KDP operon response regulator KdpE